MNLKCLLIDDEPPALKVLTTYVANMDNLDLAGTCANAFEAMQVLKDHPVDVLFLDIKMPRLLGTEFIRTLRNPPKVIFTTAHKDYALEGFELDAVDYLLKPFSFERFVRAVNKLTSANDPLSGEHPGNTGRSGPDERPNPAGPAPAEAFLYFRVDRKMIKVELCAIRYVESLKDYSRIVRSEDKPLIVKKPIGSIEQMLPAPRFLRIHRSFIIAADKITAFTQNDIEIGDQEIPIGKLYRHQLARITHRNT
jgi:DNA-binding LytR/AlgR family response regulator